MMRYVRLGLVSALWLVAGLLPASAHRVGIPVTTLEWHEPSGSWHLIHKVSAHDLEPALGVEGLAREEIYETRDGQARIARYVLENFTLKGHRAAVEFSYIGAENDADQVWIYFELRSPDQLLSIRNTLLHGRQTEGAHALVNVHNRGGVETLLFASLDGEREVSLERP